MKRRWVLVTGLALVASACTSAQGDTATSEQPSITVTADRTSTPLPAPADTPLAAGAELRWIDLADGGFLDTRTGQPFVPVGVNLLRKVGGGGGDRLFALYDPVWVDGQLETIASMGFNTVRFFLDMCMECTATSDGIRDDYLDDLADLLTGLERHGLVALPTSNDIPDPGFSERLPCCEPFGGYRNSLYLSAEGHQIAVEYWTALLNGLAQRRAPTHHVLGWQLANEQFVLRDVPPIDLTSGSVTTADGVTYDLSDEGDVREMVAANLRIYISTVGESIRTADEGALVTMGFFSADDPAAGRTATDNRWVVPDQIIDDSTLDFVDLHAYPGLGGTWDAIGAAYGLGDDEPEVPIILGEFGAFKDAYRTPDEAAAAMARWQAESCALGFAGWLLWFWGAATDDEVITADVHQRAVAAAVSPLTRPDPCDAGPYVSSNLALGRAVTASAEESPEYDASHVVDGSDATWWSAAQGPPQWVEIDLDGPQTVGAVDILIGYVSPPGPQTHRVLIRTADNPDHLTVANEISVDAEQGEWISIELPEAIGDVTAVRVETVSTEGWVIVHEVVITAG
jgi:hypothetical protein